MPRFDRTGPLGTGPIGRGLGPCGGGQGGWGSGRGYAGWGRGPIGFGRGFGWRMWRNTGFSNLPDPLNTEEEKALLEQEKSWLETQLDAIIQRLKGLDKE